MNRIGKITEVGYEYLFNTGDYQNRKIMFRALVQEGEKEEDVLLRMYLKAHRLNAVLTKQIQLVYAVRDAENYFRNASAKVHDMQEALIRAEEKVIEFADRINEPEDKLEQLERKRTLYCERERIGEIKESLEQKVKERAKAEEELKSVRELSLKLRDLLKNGDVDQYRPSMFRLVPSPKRLSGLDDPFDYEDDELYNVPEWDDDYGDYY